MPKSNDVLEPDEIDLSDLIQTLWRKKFFILFITFLFSISGLYYAYFKAEIVYESTAIFTFKNGKDNGLNFGALETAARFSGLDGLGNTKEQMFLDQIYGADFLRKIVKKLKLKTDPTFFTPHTKPVKGSISYFKDVVKSTLHINNQKTLTENDITDLIRIRLKNKLFISVTKSGAYKIVASSKDPSKAADLANTVMNEFLKLKLDTKIKNTELSLSYLSKTLTSFKVDLDTTNDKIEKFQLENNILSQNEFKLQAVRLNEFRTKISEIKNLISELNDLNLYFEGSTKSTPNLRNMLNKLYGLSPRLQSLTMKLDKKNNKDLQFELNLAKTAIGDEIYRNTEALDATEVGFSALVKTATSTSANARQLTELLREAEIKSLFFETMIRQIGSSKVATGFVEDLGEIYETAIPPLHPSAPRKKAILTISFVLGLLLGCGLSFLLEAILKKIWTIRKIEAVLGIEKIIELRTQIYKIKNLKTLLFKYNKKKALPSDTFKINKLIYELNSNPGKPKDAVASICIADFGQEPLIRFALLIGSVLKETGKTVAIIDMTYRNSFSNSGLRKRLPQSNDDSSKLILFEDVAYERLEPPRNLEKSSEFQNTIQARKSELTKHYSCVLTLVDSVESENAGMTQLFTNEHLIILTKAGQIKMDNLLSIRSILREEAHRIVSVLFFK